MRTILPWGQYFAWRMSGRAVSGNTELGAQTQLVDVANNRFSSLARARGWDKLFAPPARPYDTLGALKPEFVSTPLAGRLEVKAGIHDSNANYLRYLAAGLGDFTLLSTGTWIIIFDTKSGLAGLDPSRDTATNTDLFSRPVACSRFMGGQEIAAIEAGAPTGSGTAEALSPLIRRGTFALPSFSDSGGPMPGSGGRGQDRRPAAANRRRAFGARRALLRARWSTSRSTRSARCSDIIVDGPFGENALFAAALAALRAPQRLLRSDLRDGTAAGAALLASISGEADMPRLSLDLTPVAPLAEPRLLAYREAWLAQATAV